MKIEPFEIGDLVQHKASGKRGVVVKLYYHCNAHPVFSLCSINPKPDCNRVYSGVVELSVDFCEDTISVEDFLLVPATEEVRSE